MISYSYTSEGSYKINEDAISSTENVFIVCDGVDGNPNGHIASHEVVDFIISRLSNDKVDVNSIANAIKGAQNHLDALVKKHTHLYKMATTMVLVAINESNSVFISHLGDSRVYLIKPQKKLYWRTINHTIVQELLDKGEVTIKESKIHQVQIIKK